MHTARIKHVVYLMEENRSFDHMFGFLGSQVNGLTGKESNPTTTFKVPGMDNMNIFVTNNAPQINPCDPDHSTPGIAATADAKEQR